MGGLDGTTLLIVLLACFVVQKGFCNGDCDPTSGCTADYTPVCGSDYQTYSNNCTFLNAQCSRKSEGIRIDIISIGECPCNPNTPCTAEYDPRCGSDDVTYANPCAFNKAKECNNNIQLIYNGPCRCATLCPAVYAPVCASDCKIYSNRCKLSTENVCKETDFKELSREECQRTCPSLDLSYLANKATAPKVYVWSLVVLTASLVVYTSQK